MTMKLLQVICLWGVVSASAIAPLQAATPPIDCHKARSVTDRALCQAPDQVAMDREIAALYDRGLSQFDPESRHRLAQSQVAFLKHRSGCAWASHHSAHPGPAVSECIKGVMDERVRVLRIVVDRGGYGAR
jgi:uncharacterized protein YecT (DUF1311 family)